MNVDDAVKFELADAHALRALHEGTASADQQKRAMRWILEKACQVGGLPFWPTDRETSFACGRQFVGKQIGRLLICDLEKLRKENAVPAPSRSSKPRG